MATRDDAAARDETEVLARLRAGDEAEFASLVDRYWGSMLHVARGFVATREAAEDVVQETFLAVVTGLDRFEGRSTVSTWMFRILVNRAKTRGEREGRIRPFSALAADDPDGPTVDPDRFISGGRWAGHWQSPPPEVSLPEAGVLASEMGARLREAIAGLPEAQRTVVELRDVAGLDADEVCELLGITEGNQRVLLHRGRAKVRTAVEAYLAGR